MNVAMRSSGGNVEAGFQPMVEAIQKMQLSARKELSVAGLVAYFQVVRKAVISAAPYDDFKVPSAYRGRVKPTRSGGAKGTLASGGFGNIIEAGASKERWVAPILKGKAPHGQITPGIMQWLQKTPQMAAVLNSAAEAMWVDAVQPTPWVLPTAQKSAAEAQAAFATRVAQLLNQRMGEA